MKIKSGFVSNSSTASFLVSFSSNFHKRTVKRDDRKAVLTILTPKQISVLKKLGFTKMWAAFPHQVLDNIYESRMPPNILKALHNHRKRAYIKMNTGLKKVYDKKEERVTNKIWETYEGYMRDMENAYGYHVDCNQSEIIIPLFQNNIPFVADVHYDQYTIKYTGGKYYYEAPNLGKLMLMACNDPEDKAGKLQRKSVAKYIKMNK